MHGSQTSVIYTGDKAYFRPVIKDTDWKIEKIEIELFSCLEQIFIRLETLILCELLKEPWTQVGIDLFKFKDKWHMVIEDYFSRFSN